MLGYSRSREDYIHILYTKYFRMNKIIFIYGEDCVKCHTLKPHIQRYCDDNWYDLEEIRYDDFEGKDNIVSLPTLIIKGETDRYLTEEDIILFITDKLW